MRDVIIVGGGPAGSAMGCYLSMAGIQNTIIEKAVHPRAHVGESMVTSSTRVFDEIGFMQTMETEGFVRKYGASWHAPNSKQVAEHRFGDIAQVCFSELAQEGIKQDYTYHVDRSKFDLLLLKHAESLGSEVYQGVTVKEVLFEKGVACGVRAGIAGQEVDLRSKVVVDASGRNTLLGRQLKLKKKDPIFNQFAIHAWFRDMDRGSRDSADHIHIYFLPVERGWVWQIPITESITSVGVVVEKEVFRQSREDLEAFFYSQMQTNSHLAHAMRGAKRENEFKTEADYSYSLSGFVGDGYVIVGDAARFVDPIFSSGVSIALYSAKYASEKIKEAIETNNVRAEVFASYEARLRQGVEIWYEFICLYYRLLPLFTYFINSKRYRLQILQLLQGEVFDRSEVPVLDAMRRFIEAAEESKDHVFRGQLAEVGAIADAEVRTT